jgi:energy-coupling factor transport system permease protein
MLKDVTFGQYYPADSFIHKCDPRTKILYLIIYIVAVFLSPNFYALGACAVVLVLSVAFAGVPVKSVLRSVKGVLFLLVFTAILNLFFYAGENTVTIAGVALKWGIINITWEGFFFMIFLSCRLFMLVMSSAILTLTTTPVNLTDGLESLLTPLKWVKFPVHVLALIMSIALRFIPTLMDETDRIMNAQKARGADFEHGSLVSRVRAIIPILIPLLISAFRRAEELGDAMEARCYSGNNPRTKYKKLRFGWRDGIVAVLILLLLAGVILLKIFTVALI